MRISDFKAVLNGYGGLARTNLFVVEITPGHQSNSDTRDLRFFCKSASMPGVNLSLAEHKPYSVGLPQQMPLGMTSEPVNCVFMLDDKDNVMSFFHRWMQAVFNYDVSNGITRESVDGLIPYEIGYASDYCMQMSIKKYSTHMPNTYYECVLSGVFPTQVSGVNLSWEDGAQVATMTVNFGYSAIKMQGTMASSIASEMFRGINGTDFFTTVGSTVIPVESFRGAGSPSDVINALTASNGNMLKFV